MEEIKLTEEERKEGWSVAVCEGNTYIKGCGNLYKKLNWHTPSGCPHCPVSFVD